MKMLSLWLTSLSVVRRNGIVFSFGIFSMQNDRLDRFWVCDLSNLGWKRSEVFELLYNNPNNILFVFTCQSFRQEEVEISTVDKTDDL
jgi:hypothetical protein